MAWEADAVARTEAALSACRAELAEARAKAVKLEGSKWARSVGDLEARAEADKRAAWQRGSDEANAAAAEEQKALKAAAAAALSEVKATAKASLEAAAKDAKESAMRAHRAGKEAGRAEANGEAEVTTTSTTTAFHALLNHTGLVLKLKHVFVYLTSMSWHGVV